MCVSWMHGGEFAGGAVSAVGNILVPSLRLAEARINWVCNLSYLRAPLSIDLGIASGSANIGEQVPR
jgi:hypothetical protein